MGAGRSAKKRVAAAQEQEIGSGYASQTYARALPQMGQPVRLPGCGGWLLRQRLGDTPFFDLRGSYPLFCCTDWQKLPTDIASLDGTAVSVSLVTDALAEVDEGSLRECFRDRFYRFKTHYIADLSQPPRSFIVKHHRKNAAKALRTLDVFEAQEPLTYLEDWCRLYAVLIQRHCIRGPQTFSDTSFAMQFRTPGIRVLVARDSSKHVVGMMLCFTQGLNAYTHLAAFDSTGYMKLASFGLMMRLIEGLSEEGYQCVDLGGVSGMIDAGARVDGLARFKQGWSNAVRSVLFCGRVLDRAAYKELCRTCGNGETEFFPAYRANASQQYVPTL